METPAPTLCFTCGLSVGEAPRLNRLTNGEICPACRDRVLDMLPAPLPSRPSEVRAGTMGQPSDAPLKN
jgi:DNA-directed RNA polymerase subunit RPC12/RpoP